MTAGKRIGVENYGSRTGDGSLDVLIVDDEPNVAQTTAEILRSEGLTASTAATVGDALEILASRDVRSVILDHQVAGENGAAFLEGVGSREKLPPVVVISGMGHDALAGMEAAHGDRLFALLSKPVPPRTLIEVMTAAIESA